MSGQEPEADTMEESCLLAHSQLVLSYSSLIQARTTCSGNGAAYCGLLPPTLIIKTIPHGPIWSKKFLPSRFSSQMTTGYWQSWLRIRKKESQTLQYEKEIYCLIIALLLYLIPCVFVLLKWSRRRSWKPHRIYNKVSGMTMWIKDAQFTNSNKISFIYV